MFNFSAAMEKASKLYKSRVYIDTENSLSDAFVCPKCKEVIVCRECDGALKEDNNNFVCPLCDKSF